jgi:carboxyl-terminal processing protease
VREATLTRAPLRIDPIQSEARDGVGYLRIRRFQEGVGEAVRAELAQSSSLGVRGWVLDLRGTASGGFQDMLDVASIFVGPRSVGRVVERGQPPTPIIATGQPLEAQMPVVLLVDGETGSAAEVLAAALREYQVADLVGTPTPGRVGIATTVRLSDGSAAQVTWRRILTPSGARLDGVGLVPDEAVDLAFEDWVQGRDPQRARAVERVLRVES